MRVLITGADGFVGAEIARQLSKSDFEIYLTGRRGARSKEEKKYWAADIADADSLQKLRGIGSIETVVHTAGLAHQFKNARRAEFWAANVEGTKNVAELAVALNAARFVLISSVAVYGKAKAGKRSYRSEDVGFEEDLQCRPQGFYAESKYESERIARRVCAGNGVELTILRLATVVGEGDAGNLRRLIRAIDKNRFLWLGDGRNLKSLIYKTDAAAACRKILYEKKKYQAKHDSAEIFNITGEAVSMRSIVEKIAAGLEKKLPQIMIPARAAQKMQKILKRFERFGRVEKMSKIVDKWLSDEVFSNAKIKAIYGFEPATSVPDAIGREVAFYKKETQKKY